MDGDRPMVDGRDIFESGLQEVLRQQGVMLQIPGYGEISDDVFHRYRQTDHVGTQDEASEEGEMGDGVRQKPDLTLESLVEQMLKNRHRAEKEAYLSGFEKGWADGYEIYKRYLSQNGIELPSTKPQVSEPL